MNSTSLILIDPQVGFCSAKGSLARYYGCEEISQIQKSLIKLKKWIGEIPRRHLVTSEYSVAQFTEGDANHPLANLCVSKANDDCSLVEELASVSFQSQHIKREPSALSSSDFNSEIENDLEQGIQTFVVAGFLFEHCVCSTAKELLTRLKGTGARVYVCSDFSASRLEKYRNGVVESAIGALLNAGVGYESWHYIKR
jgi:nicotinamidase-related amidase